LKVVGRLHYSSLPFAVSNAATTKSNKGHHMNRGKLLIATAVVASLAGCASPMVWNKYGASQADYQQDAYACEKDARQSGYFGGGIAGAINMREFFKHCMVAHGWALQTG
jgi:hypothetical protein